MEGRGGIILNFSCWDQYFGGQWRKIHHESILAPLQYWGHLDGREYVFINLDMH